MFGADGLRGLAGSCVLRFHSGRGGARSISHFVSCWFPASGLGFESGQGRPTGLLTSEQENSSSSFVLCGMVRTSTQTKRPAISGEWNKDDICRLGPDEFMQRCHIERKIGSGGFAEVYKGSFDGRRVAFKVLRSSKHTREALFMFMQEAKALKTCSHSHIVKFVKLVLVPQGVLAQSDGQRWAICLELLEGGPLSKLVARQLCSPGKSLYSDYQAVQWCRQVAAALAYLHKREAPVLHRDVKLDNIMLTRQSKNSPWTAKLGDFGLHVTLDACRQPVLRKSASCPSVQDFMSSFSQQGGVNDIASLQAASSLPLRLRTHNGAQGSSLGEFCRLRPSTTSGLLTPASPLCRAASMTEIYSSNFAQPAFENELEMPAAFRRFSLHSSYGSGSTGVGPLQSMVQFAYGTRPICGQAMSVEVAESLEDAVVFEDLLSGGKGLSAEKESMRHKTKQVDEVDDPDEELRFNLTGRTGSCVYMAPEVYRREPYNHKVDVFSFGAIMYELLSRSLLALDEISKGEGAERYAERVASGYRPDAWASSIPKDLWAIIQSCWHSDPFQRPNMQGLLAQLDEWLASHACTTSPKVQRMADVLDDEPVQRCGCVIS